MAKQGLVKDAQIAIQQAHDIRKELGQANLYIEAVVALGGLKLTEGKPHEAMAIIESAVAKLGTGTLAGVDDPIEIIITCRRICEAANQSADVDLLALARELIQTRSDSISPERRDTYLASVPDHMWFSRSQ